MIIAEIGQAHDGSIGIAHSYIDALSKVGIKFIKFQTHIASAESSMHEEFRINFSYEDKSRFDYWKRMEFSLEQWIGLKKHCEDKNIEFLSTPFSVQAVDLLENIGVKQYKIGSGDTNNLLLLNKIAEKKKPVILSTGLSTIEDVDRAVDFFKMRDIPLSILQCSTNYPALPHNWGLNMIVEYKSRYDLPVGYSDHSGSIFACLAATTLGAELIEFHVTFDKDMFGPDSTSSLTINEIKILIEGVNNIKIALNHPNNKFEVNKHKTLFSRSITINKKLSKGHIIEFCDLETTKPGGHGVSPEKFSELIGKKLNDDKDIGEFLTFKDVE